MLFDDPPIPGLRLRDKLIDAAQEADLIARILAEPLTPFQFQGFEGKRLTRSFGWHYDFSAGRLVAADPIPRWLRPVRERCAAFAGVPAAALAQCLLIRYDAGAGIGWHRDRPAFAQIVGLSLGAPAELQFRRRLGPRRFARTTVPLAPRSAYLLAGEARHDWEHAIPEHRAERFSITFRALAEPHQNGRDLAFGTDRERLTSRNDDVL